MNDNTSAFLNKFAGFVQILPNETVLQFTNFAFNFNTETPITASIVDSCGKTLKTFQNGYDIMIRPILNEITGKNQLIYEFISSEDYGERIVLLKFTSSGKSIYSYPFFSTESSVEETSLFYYKNEGYLLGVPYNEHSYYQVIRLRCFKNDSDQETENEEIIQLSGNKFYSRTVTTPINKFLFYLSDFFTFNRLVSTLRHNIIYIDKQRHTSSPSKISKAERIQDSNVFQLDFEGNPIDEYLDLQSQIILELFVTKLEYPDDTTFQFNDEISKRFTVFFNRSIFIFNDAIRFHLYKNGNLVESKKPNSFNNQLFVDFDNDFSNGEYFILVDGGKAGCNTPIQRVYWVGISEITDWNFTVLDKPIEPDAFVNLSWEDESQIDLSGNLTQGKVKIRDFDFANKTVLAYSWQRRSDTTPFTEYSNLDQDFTVPNFNVGENIFRLIITFTDNSEIISNELKYIRVQASIYIDNVRPSSNGETLFDLHVVGNDFIGFANTVATKKDNSKILYSTFSFGLPITLTNATPINTDVHKSVAVNIPAGIYQDCFVNVTAVSIIYGRYTESQAGLSFGATPDYYELAAPNVSATYIEPEIG
ncbi:hypothetical protein PQ459_10075 [Chryseobacterium sp. KACC 21268]|nr:hypothetical protein PQ459_10075 [Chryseobacterium sp. KACC 21268]